MATSEEDFIKTLRATFRVEAEEHLQAISSTLLELEKAPSALPPLQSVENVYREAHSLKGAARAVDFGEIESICQAVEGVFAGWKRELSCPSPEALDALHSALDEMHALLESAETGPAQRDPRSRDELIQRLGRFRAGGGSGGGKDVVAPKTAPPTAAPLDVAPADASPPPPPPPIQGCPEPAAPPSSAPTEPEKGAVAQTVRIPVEKLDSRLVQAEDMLFLKTTATQRVAELRELTDRFGHWRRQWAKVSADASTLRKALEHQQPGGAGATATISLATAGAGALVNFLDWNSDYLRSLENKLVSLTAQAEQDRHGTGRRVDDLLEDSKKLLMLPFSTMAAVFPKLVRDLCRDQNKEADLVIQGGDVEIDKRILEEIKDPLIHILRNCVDHGVELPAQRQQAAKPARATITIAVSANQSNKVQIIVSDDGAGVDRQRLKDSAVSHGIISSAQAAGLSDEQVLELAFQSEVSTSPVVTAISGRGLGMAIVRARVEQLGGRVSIQSTPGAGMTLQMALPLTLATFRGVLVSVSDRTFVIPAVSVDRVLRIKPQDIRTVENRPTISLGAMPLSLARLDAVLELPPKSPADDLAPLPAVLLHSADVRIAFVVDQILREEEVLVKPLRKPLNRVRHVAGITVLSSGKTAPVLNVSDLIQTARRIGPLPAPASPGAKPAKTPQAPQKRVLVVEDSITSRMLLKGILESAGYVVRTAVDGVDAFTALREDHIDLVVSDVEMPRMNGFDLAGRIRADKRLADLPVVLVSALESRDERERGIDVGASAYIIKSSFDQGNLLEAVRRLI
jgi:two-component system, chemotaxis family, sensor kinase CheA